MFDEDTDRRVRDGYSRIPSAAEITPRRSQTGYRKPKKLFKAKPKYGSRPSQADKNNDMMGAIIILIAAAVIVVVILIALGIIHI